MCVFIIITYMLRIVKIGLYIFFVCVITGANAFSGSVQTGVGMSVLGGLNILAGYKFAGRGDWLDKFGVRLDFADTAPIKSALDSAIDHIMRDGIDVGDGVRIDEGKLDSTHYAALIDFYPFNNAWRLTGGYMFADIHMDTAIMGEIAEIPSYRFYFYINGDYYYYNGNSFQGSTSIDWDYNGMYLGTGFDVNLGCRFYLYLDAGVVYTNRPARLSMVIPHEQLYIYDVEKAVWTPVAVPKLDSDVAAATDDANRKLSHIRLAPVIKLGFLYRF